MSLADSLQDSIDKNGIEETLTIIAMSLGYIGHSLEKDFHMETELADITVKRKEKVFAS